MKRDWKRVERKIAAMFGLERQPVPGRQRGDKPDISGDSPIVGEVKTKKALPEWLHDAMDQAKKSANDSQLPMVVLHEKQKPYNQSYVVIVAEDFAEFVNEFVR